MMCDAKPGIRCAADTRVVAEDALWTYEDTHQGGPAVEPLTSARELQNRLTQRLGAVPTRLERRLGPVPRPRTSPDVTSPAPSPEPELACMSHESGADVQLLDDEASASVREFANAHLAVIDAQIRLTIARNRGSSRRYVKARFQAEDDLNAALQRVADADAALRVRLGDTERGAVLDTLRSAAQREIQEAIDSADATSLPSVADAYRRKQKLHDQKASLLRAVHSTRSAPRGDEALHAHLAFYDQEIRVATDVLMKAQERDRRYRNDPASNPAPPPESWATSLRAALRFGGPTPTAWKS